MKKLVLVFSLISCLTSCEKEEVSECYSNHYGNGELLSTTFYSNNIEDDGKFLMSNSFSKLVVECE